MKMKTLDDAVIELNGVLPSCIKNKFNTENGWYISTKGKLAHSESCVWFDMREFQQRAKELGFVGRYRWGVEYKTDGKQPELADDVEIKWQAVGVKEWWPKHGDTTSGELDWNGKYAVYSFKITDPRFKPADTSYLDKPDSSIHSVNNYNEGAEHFEWIANQFDNVDDANAVWALRDKLFQSRKAKAERKRVVDAAMAVVRGRTEGNAIEALYDKGFLRLPD